MSDSPDVTLHYFDVRGRGQFIRALLDHRDVPFDDDRIVLGADRSAWLELRPNRAVTGPMQKLPTLQWGEHLLGEALLILDFLHHRLGDADSLTERDNLRHAMLRSSAFLDVITPCINLVWCDIFHPGVDLAGTVAMVRHRLSLHLATLDETLRDWRWNDAMVGRPVMAADAVLWEALDMVRLAFDGQLDLDAHEVLATFYRDCPGRDGFEALLQARPVTLTARPGEAEQLARIHASL